MGAVRAGQMSTDDYYHTGYVWRPNRRREPRVRSEGMLTVEQMSGSERVGHIMDLSAGGVRFQTVGTRVTFDEVVRIAFNVGEETFNLFGKAVRVQNLDAFSQEVALSFAGLEPVRRETLRRGLVPPS